MRSIARWNGICRAIERMILGTIELLQLCVFLNSVSKDDSNSHISHVFKNFGPYKLQKNIFFKEKWKYIHPLILQTVDTFPPIFDVVCIIISCSRIRIYVEISSGEICLTQVVTLWRVYNFAFRLVWRPEKFFLCFLFWTWVQPHIFRKL